MTTMRLAAAVMWAGGSTVFAQQPPPLSVPADFSYASSPQIHVLNRLDRVQHLKGRVVGRSGDMVMGPVLVEIVRSLGSDGRIDARFTDQNGNFNFGEHKKGRYFLKVSMNGFDTVYFGVNLGGSGKSDIRVELQPST